MNNKSGRTAVMNTAGIKKDRQQPKSSPAAAAPEAPAGTADPVEFPQKAQARGNAR
jgi:hypothetical protein